MKNENTKNENMNLAMWFLGVVTACIGMSVVDTYGWTAGACVMIAGAVVVELIEFAQRRFMI